MLAFSLVLAAPLTAQAGHHHGSSRGFIMIPQKPAYKKPQTVTPENPAVVQARQQRLAKLKADLEAIAPKATPTEAQTAAVYQDLMAVVDGSNRPAPAMVQKLSAHLAGVMARRGPKTALDTQTLAQNLKVVMNSAYVMELQSHMATRTSHELLTASGAADADSQAVVNDLKTIATQALAQGKPGMIR
jgi:hypothetical protein